MLTTDATHWENVTVEAPRRLQGMGISTVKVLHKGKSGRLYVGCDENLNQCL